MIDLSVYGSLSDLLCTIQLFCSTIIALLIAGFDIMLNIWKCSSLLFRLCLLHNCTSYYVLLKSEIMLIFCE